jgi:hypothetical protein
MSAALAQAPRLPAKVPIFHDAVHDPVAEQGYAASSESNPETLYTNEAYRLTASSAAIYSTPAAAEEVLRFYLQGLHGEEDYSLPDPDYDLDRGATSDVSYFVSYYEWQFRNERESSSGKLLRDGNRVKSTLAGARKPLNPNQWVYHAQLQWYAKDARERIHAFAVILDDDSFAPDWERYRTKTQIRVLHQEYRQGR